MIAVARRVHRSVTAVIVTGARSAVTLLLLWAAGCERTDDLYPLKGDSTAGLTSVAWGDDPVAAVAKLGRMPGVGTFHDTVVAVDLAVHVSPETVSVTWPPFRTTRFVQMSGGRFLGFEAEAWNMTFAGSERLEDLTIVVRSERNPVQTIRLLRERLMQFYGDPTSTDARYVHFRADGWDRRAADPDAASTSVSVWHWRSRRGTDTSSYIIQYTDKRTADSVRAAGGGEKRLLSVKEWEALKRERPRQR